MATLPGMPKNDDDPEAEALPVEPDDGMPNPTVPNEPEGTPGEAAPPA